MQIEFSKEQIQLIKSQVAPKATDDELQLFLYQCKRTGLDPLTRQIYCIHRKSGGTQKMTIQTSIDGFRVIAERSGDYGGQSKPLFTYDSNGDLLTAEVTVFRFRGETRYECAVGVAFWSEYCVTNDEWINNQKTGKKVPTDMWAKMKHTMLSKVAEALALRKAYPQDLSGLYTSEEMAQMDNYQEAEVVSDPKRLPEGGAVPFSTQFTQSQAQPVVAQQQQTAHNQLQAQQVPPITPFNRAYASIDAIVPVISSAANEEDFKYLYHFNKDLFTNNPILAEKVAQRRSALQSPGKPTITDAQFNAVCARIAKGEEKAAEQAKNFYILNQVQSDMLDQMLRELKNLEAAVVVKYNNPADLLTLIQKCPSTEFVLKLHSNNAMIIDRDPELATRLNARLKELKAAA